MPVSRSTRFVDIDHDCDADLIFSDGKDYGLWLFESASTGWSKKLMSGKSTLDCPVPPITVNGQNYGAWFRKDEMVVVNEFTAAKKDHVIIRNYQDWLKQSP